MKINLLVSKKILYLHHEQQKQTIMKKSMSQKEFFRKVGKLLKGSGFLVYSVQISTMIGVSDVLPRLNYKAFVHYPNKSTCEMFDMGAGAMSNFPEDVLNQIESFIKENKLK